METQLSQLKENGYCVFDQAFEKEVLEKIKRVSRRALGKLSIKHRNKNKSQGSLILIADYPDFGMLIGNEEIIEIFRILGFGDTRFSSGYIISKPKKVLPFSGIRIGGVGIILFPSQTRSPRCL